jgi:phospholipase C
LSGGDFVAAEYALTPSDQAAELAVPLSIAVRVEPELIRAIRLAVLPYLDVAAESDFWFSDLVASRGPDSIILDPAILPALRGKLAHRVARSSPADPIRAVWDITARVHARISPALLLEERVTWLAVSAGEQGMPAIEEELGPALYALAVEGRAGIADWLVGAWGRLPDTVRGTRTAWRLRQAAARHIDTANLPVGVVPTGFGVADLAEFAADLRDAPLGVRAIAGGLELGDLAPSPGTAALLTLDTDPRIVELLPEGDRPGTTLAVPRGDTVHVPVGPGPIRLRTPRGLVYEITPRLAGATIRPAQKVAEPETFRARLSTIDHIVVLMLGQRSFDHMLGFLYAGLGNRSPAGHPYEGLTGTESNPDPSDQPVTVFGISPDHPNAYFMPGACPGLGYMNTNSQLYGNNRGPAEPGQGNQGFVTNFAYTLAWQANVSGYSIVPGTVAGDIMGCFAPEALPVLSGLARGYAVCDHWFASVPTSTIPNRAFAWTGTSQGRMNSQNTTFTSPSIFGLLGQHGLSWAIYGYNAMPLTWKNHTDIARASGGRRGTFTDFAAAAAAGNLAAFTLLEPSWASTGNSQHPPYNVALGEQLIHDIYYTLRNSPAWSRTLLVITYAAHGGCYDHVPPPRNAVPPDDSPGMFGFDFTRFGARVPAVLVSPLIEVGKVFRVQAAVLDHTSIIKTVQQRWDLPPLTARDAAAPSLADVLTLGSPRTDDPLIGVTIPHIAKPNQRRPSPRQRVR